MTSRSIKVWVIIFTVEMSVVSFFYLLQDKWVYTQKQGVILGDQTVKPTGGEEIAPETSKRSWGPSFFQEENELFHPVFFRLNDFFHFLSKERAFMFLTFTVIFFSSQLLQYLSMGTYTVFGSLLYQSDLHFQVCFLPIFRILLKLLLCTDNVCKSQ